MASNAANDAAALWAIRLDAGELPPDQQVELDAWLAANPGHEGSLLRAQAALAYLDRGRALSGGDAYAGAADHPRWRLGRRAFLVTAGSGIAAAIAGFAILRPRPLTIETITGEVRRVPLADGSHATVNTSSRIAVAMADSERRIALDRGEAWFEVAPDKARPFIVEAGDIRVRAVGTAFSVRRRESGADILVTEGTVEAWVVGREDRRQPIGAGSRAFVSDAAAGIEVASAPGEIDRTLAWRSGELVLDGETLGYAVGEINRYNVRKLVVGDPKLAVEPLVGYFKTTQPEDFARTAAMLVEARVVVEGDVIRLERTAR